MRNNTTFPDGFTWGAAAASYQIEGGARVDGKGLSVWDMLTGQAGRIWQGHTGDVACDHYHRYAEDVAIMRQIGLHAYRLSISWPRVIPGGIGRVNEAGLGFYDRLVDNLLANGVEPWVTLFHWDYPYELFLRGGWLNPESPKWFAEYTQVLCDRLSDRVSNWMTVNEPQCFIGLGHFNGEHAPGLKLGMPEVLTAAHNSLLAHGYAVQVLRAAAKRMPVIGWAPVGVASIPASGSVVDVHAAREATYSVNPSDVWNSTWWGDPAVLGHYPEQGLRAYGRNAPKFTSADFEIIKQPLDFYGINIYSSPTVKANEDGKAVSVPIAPGHPHTHFLWNQTPEALYWGPKFMADRYGLPIVITENGMSNVDVIALDGKCHDPQRIDFLNRYLLELRRAVADGVDIRGYFQWSIMDNFEWAEGYKHRFGLVHVDFQTQKRTLKDSAHWYGDVIRSNGATLSADTPQESPSQLPASPIGVISQLSISGSTL